MPTTFVRVLRLSRGLLPLLRLLFGQRGLLYDLSSRRVYAAVR